MNKQKKKIRKGTEKREEQIVKKNEFEAYLEWRKIPSIIKNIPNSEGKKIYQIDNELYNKLINIKTQTEFCQVFNVDKDTLTRWNKKIKENDLLNNSWKEWGKKYTPNVIGGLARRATAKGTAAEVKYFMELIEGIKTELSLNIPEGTKINLIVNTIDNENTEEEKK